MNKFNRHAIWTAAGFFAASGFVDASVIYTTGSGYNTSSGYSVTGPTSSYGNIDVAMPFSTPAGSYQIDSITVAIGQFNYDGTNQVEVTLHASDGLVPGAALQTVTISCPEFVGKVTADFGGTTTISSGNTYWVSLSVADVSEIGWAHSSPTVTTQIASRGPGGWWLPNDTASSMFEVLGTSVPEPTATVLLGIAGMGALVRRRRS